MNIRIEKKLETTCPVHVITVRNSKDFEVVLTDRGAAIYSIAYPDRSGTMGKVTEACRDLEKFIHAGNGFGKTIAPVAGRIEDATATLDGTVYTFPANEGKNNLHSADANMAFRLWKFDVRTTASKTDVIFTAKGIDGDAGFPGNIDYKVTYTIYETKKELSIRFYAKPDRPAFINMTNHVYFNLNGGTDKIFDQELWINAGKVADMDDGLIIHGFVDVPGHLNFQEPAKLGPKITVPVLMNHRSHGMDHPFLFNQVDKSKPCASLYDPATKRKMTMYTSLPALICYCDNFPDRLENQAGVIDDGNYGITFESIIPTHDTDAIVFTKDHPYSHITKYKFN